MFDRRGSGSIEMSELKAALQSMGEPVDDDDVKEMCQLAGMKADGMVKYYELIAQMFSK